MGNLSEAQGLPEVGPFAEELHEAAVVLVQELAEDEHGEELGLGKVVTGLGAGEGGQGAARDTQGDLG